MNHSKLSDEQARTRALDPATSFIVQAPAGSGKTELLTQRYLKLLGSAVKNPEEIIAITFTRKAASEMRDRIFNSLVFAQNNPEPQEPHKKITWQLATNALTCNQQYNWQLLDNPNRLRVLTIDALSSMLSAQIPLLSRFGAKPIIADDPEPYYQNAIHNLLEDKDLQPELNNLLLHLDNNANLLVGLLTNLLKRREQWLPYIIQHYQQPETLKQLLEAGLENLINESLIKANRLIPIEQQATFVELSAYAAKNLCTTNPEHHSSSCLNLIEFPVASHHNLQQWQFIAEVFLTKSLTLRKQVDKRSGFPADNKTMKQLMLETLETLRDNTELETALTNIIQCPPIQYSNNQWTIVKALLKILPPLTAQLHLQFRQYGAVDFVELTLGALRALGQPTAPTDLALYLDFQIRHILVDEFQDTSAMQHNLLKRITQEWQSDEGKTLFVVGDPMQSIYRFRNAEVSLFLQAQQFGIANIELYPLTLQKNFRSNKVIVEWINSTFKQVFPTYEDIINGAVPYSQAIATRDNDDNSRVKYYSSSSEDNLSNAEEIIEIIKHYQEQSPDESIAILVRSRSQLADIIPQLNQEKLNYQAVELERLNQRQEIIDLVSLTRALLHSADKIAWLAILRAPWCGLKLQDLHSLTQQASNKPLWIALQHYQQLKTLSIDAQQRLEKIVPILAHSKQAQGRLPLSQWIKGTWQALHGDQCLPNTASNNTKSYFDLLEQIEDEFNLDLLERKLAHLFAKPEQKAHCSIQVMTIHKSKGLEFDHVIIPELQTPAPYEPNHLLMWLERQNAEGNDDLILAPIKANFEDFDPIHRCLKTIEDKKLSLERARLLYVAATRAKKSLHLFTKLSIDEKTGEFKSPSKRSFFGLLWPVHQNNFINSFTMSEQQTEIELPSKQLIRLKEANQDQLAELTESSSAKNHVEPINQQQKLAALIGTLSHEALASLNDREKLDADSLNKHWQRRLTQMNVAPENQETIINRLTETLKNMSNDPVGNWILQAHCEQENEYAITHFDNGNLIQQIIDRTFIDENNTRWIIDYKTATPNTESIQEFLNTQKAQHEKQLHAYAKTMQQMDKRKIQLGLYFPMCCQWVKWEYTHHG